MLWGGCVFAAISYVVPMTRVLAAVTMTSAVTVVRVPIFMMRLTCAKCRRRRTAARTVASDNVVVKRFPFLAIWRNSGVCDPFWTDHSGIRCSAYAPIASASHSGRAGSIASTKPRWSGSSTYILPSDRYADAEGVQNWLTAA